MAIEGRRKELSTQLNAFWLCGKSIYCDKQIKIKQSLIDFWNLLVRGGAINQRSIMLLNAAPALCFDGHDFPSRRCETNL